MSKVYVGDTGTAIVLECGVDISAATSKEINVRKPDGSEVAWTATLSGTTALQYISAAGTFDMKGKWLLQAEVQMPGGGKWLGETASLTVYEAFK